MQVSADFVVIRTKKCAGRCGLVLSLDSFGLQKRGLYGRRSQCRSCRGETERTRVADFPEQVKAEKRAWYVRDRYATAPVVPVASTQQQRLAKLEMKLLYAARSRARSNGLPCTITLSDINVPERCPYLGILLEIGAGRVCDASPSLDRIDPALGYVPGNVEVISNRANLLKNNGTADEHEKIAKRMRALGCL